MHFIYLTLLVCFISPLLTPLDPPSSAGPSIESAHQSGRMLADAIFERFEKGIKKDVGLDSSQFFQVNSYSYFSL